MSSVSRRRPIKRVLYKAAPSPECFLYNFQSTLQMKALKGVQVRLEGLP